jgi:hypothetical protein
MDNIITENLTAQELLTQISDIITSLANGEIDGTTGYFKQSPLRRDLINYTFNIINKEKIYITITMANLHVFDNKIDRDEYIKYPTNYLNIDISREDNFYSLNKEYTYTLVY